MQWLECSWMTCVLIFQSTLSPRKAVMFVSVLRKHFIGVYESWTCWPFDLFVRVSVSMRLSNRWCRGSHTGSHTWWWYWTWHAAAVLSGSIERLISNFIPLVLFSLALWYSYLVWYHVGENVTHKLAVDITSQITLRNMGVFFFFRSWRKLQRKKSSLHVAWDNHLHVAGGAQLESGGGWVKKEKRKMFAKMIGWSLFWRESEGLKKRFWWLQYSSYPRNMSFRCCFLRLRCFFSSSSYL